VAFFVCTKNDLALVKCENVRWLEKEADYELARLYWKEVGQISSLNTWAKAHEYGYQYAGILEGGRIISLAGVWRFSQDCWEVVAVSTLENCRRKGYSRSIVAFITSYILKSGRLATCSTDDDNIAMIATASSVGFRPVPVEKIWWAYPQLPDF
jgi:predicted GNAT family acetyltransferase